MTDFDHHILGMGYNAWPKGLTHNSRKDIDSKESIIHAEMNALCHLNVLNESANKKLNRTFAHSIPLYTRKSIGNLTG